ncbi:uncharacterized protein TRIADDRAFT_53548 [Trichoplax adhaerens]|uniref:Transmembrane protein 186 n=1 Tax=Trichoplax adhaerens TaxID=10228 RepID=B3RPH7_TRIAD|nr:hypothetical protein TRIADDRAFT_53548 [Trichoplax adhaerens]EDV28190.1 hypothetical protein TRIADDRAFT_53548 [Trichoplax adhaerens]|eukprot:XP_002110024.1 hypothetical protein TRIADDRAFT_53548 [Trichoplax adhaerens]
MNQWAIPRTICSVYQSCCNASRWGIQGRHFLNYQANIQLHCRRFLWDYTRPTTTVRMMTMDRWIARQKIPNSLRKWTTTANLYCTDENKCKDVQSTRQSRNQFSGYQLLYKLPRMHWFRFASRFKLFQVGFMLSLSIPSCYWYTHQMISNLVFWTTISTATSTTVALFVFSYFFRRIIGELWISDDDQEIILSTLTFWGNRRNRHYPVESVVSWSDGRMAARFLNDEIIQYLEINGAKEDFYYSIPYGKIYDHPRFLQVIGYEEIKEMDDI